jgi:hypothetical protein
MHVPMLQVLAFLFVSSWISHHQFSLFLVLPSMQILVLIKFVHWVWPLTLPPFF